MLSGYWAWEVCCETCGTTSDGVVKNLDDLTFEGISQEASMGCTPPSCNMNIVQRQPSLKKLAQRTGQTDLLTTPPLGQFRYVNQDFDTVAVDMSYKRKLGDRWGWGAVTGAGWAYGDTSRVVKRHGDPTTPSYLEALGIVAALHRLPEGRRYKVLCDSQDAVEAFCSFPEWMDDKLHGQIVQVCRKYHFQLEWRRRNSDDLMSAADWVARSMRMHEQVGRDPNLMDEMSWVNPNHLYDLGVQVAGENHCLRTHDILR